MSRIAGNTIVFEVRNREGKLHRENDCARIWSNGTKEYWQNGVRHRDNGPAIEYLPSRLGGEKPIDEYWVDGVQIKGDNR